MQEELQQQLAKRIRLARQQAGYKQESVASALSLSSSALSGIETGQRQVSAVELYRLSHFYHRPMDWFFSSHPEY